jgi:hypothetical protein
MPLTDAQAKRKEALSQRRAELIKAARLLAKDMDKVSLGYSRQYILINEEAGGPEKQHLWGKLQGHNGDIGQLIAETNAKLEKVNDEFKTLEALEKE